jgi:hypothetical protein
MSFSLSKQLLSIQVAYKRDFDEVEFENGISFISWKQVEDWVRKANLKLNRLFKD